MKKLIAGLTVLLSISVLFTSHIMAAEFESTNDTMEYQATDYTYLFERSTSQKANIFLPDVNHIAILFTSSPLPQSLFLDLEDAKSYYDPGRDIYYNIQISKYISDLSADERQQIERIWSTADFMNWDFYYEGTQELDYECHLAIETRDSVYHYEIKGVDALAPDSLMDFITDILHTFWDPEIISQ